MQGDRPQSSPHPASLEPGNRSLPAQGGRRFAAPDYLARLMPHLEGYGITRLADVTGLDRLGIPVVQAIRPLALSNAVNQGKGLALAEAAVSAIVEALETCFSEALPSERMKDLAPADVYGAAAGDRLRHHLFPDCAGDWAEHPVPFIEGTDLLSGDRCKVPAALVSTDYTSKSPHANAPFLRTTTGLGGGASHLEALVHALHETLERLATDQAMNRHGFLERSRIDPSGALDAPTAMLLDRLEGSDLLCGIYECPPVGGYPVIWARLLDARHGATSLTYHAEGYACRSTLAEAIRAALLEAVQTRGAVIAGAREDITWRHYPRRTDDELLAFERAQLQRKPDRDPSFFREPGDETPASLARAIAGQGRRAIAVSVAEDTRIPLHVVRVVTLADETLENP